MTDAIPLSLLNDYLYCPRRAALKAIEGYREENQHTAIGDLIHEHADLPGYEVAKGVLVWRALPVWSDRLGLNGKCDIVEVEANLKSGSQPPKSLCPVEYKKGKRRQFDNDDAQLCAQALCLEEMFSIPVVRGAVFHAASKRRREIEFTPELRALTENAIARLHELIAPPPPTVGRQVPPAVFKPACEECSLFEICLPKATSASDHAARIAQRIFQV